MSQRLDPIPWVSYHFVRVIPYLVPKHVGFMKKILLVEDNSANRLLFSRLISSQGFICICASDGLRGLHVLEDNPDIIAVFSDCQMPNLDGKGMAQEIRRRKGNPFPIFLYSSFLSAKEWDQLIQNGATAVLNYPLTPKQVEESMRAILNPA
jgi:CheY-like chemotaxis protein